MEARQNSCNQRNKINSGVLVPHCVKLERIILSCEWTQNAVSSRLKALFPPEN